MYLMRWIPTASKSSTDGRDWHVRGHMTFKAVLQVSGLEVHLSWKPLLSLVELFVGVN